MIQVNSVALSVAAARPRKGKVLKDFRIFFNTKGRIRGKKSWMEHFEIVKWNAQKSGYFEYL
jgi:hypothetical protein